MVIAMTPELLKTIAVAYGFASLHTIKELSSGGINRSWHVKNDQQQHFFLKVFDASDASRGELEASILSHLNAQTSPAYRVQLLVRTHLGAPLFTSGERTYLLTKWQNGSTRGWQEFSSDNWHSLGATLGALHRRLRGLRLPALPIMCLSQRVAGLDRESEITKIASHRLLAAQKETYPFRQKADTYFEQRLMILDRFFPVIPRLSSDNEQLVHNDYTEPNFIFDTDGIVMITDWERAIYAPPEYDVVRSLVIMPIVAPAHAARFIEGYQRFSPINPPEIRDMVGVYLIEQALKHWPTERWLRGEDWGRVQFESNFEIIELLARQYDLLLNFYAENC